MPPDNGPYDEPRPFRVGDRIIEKQHNSHPKVIETIAEGHYIMARGLRLTRISWRNINRYRHA